jgi:beta-lactam-binding protein with PASTA domain
VSNQQRRLHFSARLIGISAGLALLMFAVGYFFAVRVLFPPLPEPKNGIVVPRLSGLLVPAAEAKLASIGLRVSDVVEIAHPSQPPGVIVAQNPLPGQQLRTAGAVTVAVSSGLPRVTIPNVVGFTAERAVAALQASGMQADQEPEPSDKPAGTVVRMSPQPGTEHTVPGRVLLFVSNGPAPQLPDTTPPAPDTLAVSASRTTT